MRPPCAKDLENKAFSRTGAAGLGGFTPNMGYESLPDHERGAVLTVLAKIEAEDPEGRWPFAARMAEVFGNYPGARIAYLRDGRNLGVRIEVATNQAMYRKLAQPASRLKPVAKQQIIYL